MDRSRPKTEPGQAKKIKAVTPETSSTDHHRHRAQDKPLHYPLNGLHLDFDRYNPGRFGPADVMAHHLFQDFLFPSRVSPDTYIRSIPARSKTMPVERIRCKDEDLALDLRTLDSMLLTDSLILSRAYNCLVHQPHLSPTSHPANGAIRVQDAVHDTIQRFYLERGDALVRRFLRTQRFLCYRQAARRPKHARREDQTPLAEPEIKHLKAYNRHRGVYQQLFLYPGPDAFTAGSQLTSHIIPRNDFFVNPDVERQGGRRQFWQSVIRGPPNPARTRSLPPPNACSFAYMANFADDSPRDSHVFWPRLSVQELDHRSRRRSLSRRHITRMFLEEPLREIKYRFTAIEAEDTGSITACANCTLTFHTTAECFFPCGYCGSGTHQALRCPVPAAKRCKCSAFPQFHRPGDCHVRCSRRCGNAWPPGHSKHKNAMSCKSRCCMCGLNGHSGLDCTLRKCRCGAIHLGQDCTWNPACRVDGCGRYLCGLHCRECGSTQRPFVGWRCQDCLRTDEPARDKDDSCRGHEEAAGYER